MTKSLTKTIALSSLIWGMRSPVGIALPPPSEIPEEVLRTEIILTGRSPIDGQLLSPAEYAKLQTELATSPFPPSVNQDLERLIGLLRLRKLLKTFIPF